LLTLGRGQANSFKKDMQSGVDFLRRRIPQVFEVNRFSARRAESSNALRRAKRI
jgi:hypothetical protein